MYLHMLLSLLNRDSFGIFSLAFSRSYWEKSVPLQEVQTDCILWESYLFPHQVHTSSVKNTVEWSKL